MRERRGRSDAHMGQEGGGHCCGLYQLPPAHTIPVPSRAVPARHFCWGWPPSPPPPLLLHCQLLLLSSPSFLPLIGPQMGTGSSCLAQQPLSCRLELPGVVLRAQALQTDRLGSIPHASS